MLKDINGCNNGTYHSSIVSQMDNLKHWRKRKIMKTLNSNELKISMAVTISQKALKMA